MASYPLYWGAVSETDTPPGSKGKSRQVEPSVVQGRDPSFTEPSVWCEVCDDFMCYAPESHDPVVISPPLMGEAPMQVNSSQSDNTRSSDVLSQSDLGNTMSSLTDTQDLVLSRCTNAQPYETSHSSEAQHQTTLDTEMPDINQSTPAIPSTSLNMDDEFCALLAKKCSLEDRSPSEIELRGITYIQQDMTLEEVRLRIEHHLAAQSRCYAAGPAMPEPAHLDEGAGETPRPALMPCSADNTPSCLSSSVREPTGQAVPPEILRYVKSRNAAPCEHSRSMASRQTGPFVCPFGCGYSIDKGAELLRHIQTTFPQEFWKCPCCDGSSPNQNIYHRHDKFIDHISNSHKHLINDGAQCGKDLGHTELCKSSRLYYNAPFPTHCPFENFSGSCPKVFRSWKEFSEHLLKHFRDKIPDGPWNLRYWPRGPKRDDESDGPSNSRSMRAPQPVGRLSLNSMSGTDNAQESWTHPMSQPTSHQILSRDCGIPTLLPTQMQRDEHPRQGVVAESTSVPIDKDRNVTEPSGQALDYASVSKGEQVVADLVPNKTRQFFVYPYALSLEDDPAIAEILWPLEKISMSLRQKIAAPLGKIWRDAQFRKGIKSRSNAVSSNSANELNTGIETLPSTMKAASPADCFSLSTSHTCMHRRPCALSPRRQHGFLVVGKVFKFSFDDTPQIMQVTFAGLQLSYVVKTRLLTGRMNTGSDSNGRQCVFRLSSKPGADTSTFPKLLLQDRQTTRPHQTIMHRFSRDFCSIDERVIVEDLSDSLPSSTRESQANGVPHLQWEVDHIRKLECFYDEGTNEYFLVWYEPVVVENGRYYRQLKPVDDPSKKWEVALANRFAAEEKDDEDNLRPA